MYIVSEELVYTFSIHFFVSHSNSNLKGKQLEWDESKQREKLPMRGKGKGGTHEGNMEEENNGYVVFKYREKNSP